MPAIQSLYYRSGRSLRFTDSGKRCLEVQISVLWSDRLVWDLLYNGVRHSVAHGAVLNDGARTLFHFPDPPADGQTRSQQ